MNTPGPRADMRGGVVSPVIDPVPRADVRKILDALAPFMVFSGERFIELRFVLSPTVAVKIEFTGHPVVENLNMLIRLLEASKAAFEEANGEKILTETAFRSILGDAIENLGKTS